MTTWQHEDDGWWTIPGACVVRTLRGTWAWSIDTWAGGVNTGATGERPTRTQAQESAERALRGRAS